MASVNVFEEGSLALKSGNKEQVQRLYDRLVEEMSQIMKQRDLMKSNLKKVSRNLMVDWCLKLVDNPLIHKMVPLR